MSVVSRFHRCILFSWSTLIVHWYLRYTMRLSAFTLLAAIVAGSIAAPAPAPFSHVSHEKRGSASHGWSKRSKLGGEVSLPMRVGMKQRSLDIGHQLLMDVWVEIQVTCVLLEQSCISWSVLEHPEQLWRFIIRLHIRSCFKYLQLLWGLEQFW